MEGVSLIPIDGHPPSKACRRYMATHGYGYFPRELVVRAIVTEELMLKIKTDHPEVPNSLHMLVGPFGVVDAGDGRVLRVAEVQVGDVVLDVEAEYEYDEP